MIKHLTSGTLNMIIVSKICNLEIKSWAVEARAYFLKSFRLKDKKKWLNNPVQKKKKNYKVTFMSHGLTEVLIHDLMMLLNIAPNTMVNINSLTTKRSMYI